MTKLSTKQRNKMPKMDFAGAGKSFPIEDKSHARNAISGAARSERVGNISKAEEKKIVAKADKKLGKKR